MDLHWLNHFGDVNMGSAGKGVVEGRYSTESLDMIAEESGNASWGACRVLVEARRVDCLHAVAWQEQQGW